MTLNICMFFDLIDFSFKREIFVYVIYLNLQDPRNNGMMLTKAGETCVDWEWEEKEEEEKVEDPGGDVFEDQQAGQDGGGLQLGGGEDIEKVLFDSATKRTPESVIESELPRRGVPRQPAPASSPSSSSSSSTLSSVAFHFALVSLYLCLCIVN